jgi:2-haloacid dehalogenase
LSKATEELVAKHPGWENEIRAYYGRWIEMLGGPIVATVDILHTLKQKDNLRLYALTNWSHETFPLLLSVLSFFTGSMELL